MIANNLRISFIILIILGGGTISWLTSQGRVAKINQGETKTESRSFQKPPQQNAWPQTRDPILAAAGDIACEEAKRGCERDATADLILSINPDAVLPLGDNQYEKGEYENYIKFYDRSWGKFKAITHPVPGNHDYDTAEAEGYFDYFNGRGASDGPAGQRSKGYYSFNLGDWHLIALNGNCVEIGGCGRDSPQERWLRQDLASQPAKCSLAYFHQPLFSSGHHGNNPLYRDLWQTLYDYHADILLNAHDHDYERFAPQNPQGESDHENGIREFVVGTGGESLYAFKHITKNSERQNDQSYGILKLTLHPKSYDWEFLPIPGESFTDSGHSNCH